MTSLSGRRVFWTWATYLSLALQATIDLVLLDNAFAASGYCLVLGVAHQTRSERTLLIVGGLSVLLIGVGGFVHDSTQSWQLATRVLEAAVVVIITMQFRSIVKLADRYATQLETARSLYAELEGQRHEEHRKRRSLISVMEDTRLEIERRKVLEQELKSSLVDLQQANADLESFSYIASHDLQAPLRNIVSFSELLEEDLKDGDQDAVQTDLRFIISGANRMSHLIDDLLAYSRAGRGACRMDPVELGDCIEEALENLATSISESCVTVAVDPQPVVQGDQRLLVQLYQNLIGNAVKFSREQPDPAVRIRALEKGGQWVFGVEDNGIGIEPEYLEQIFVPFKRLHSADEFEGSGIGLAICRRIVEHHNGRIWVESRPGCGSHFWFTLGEEALCHETDQSA